MDLVKVADGLDDSVLADEIKHLFLDGPISDALAQRAESHTFVRLSETAVAKLSRHAASPPAEEFVGEYFAAHSGGGLCRSDICMSKQICHTDVCPPQVEEK
ncbi:hypothetical protein ACC684_36705 [Rhizobium ruizarguesonis]|uniref:hypothetical protein n=1 Tax=Rhizobium TaxID=379 RepID=UPI000370193D|nr:MULTISPECIES: hypothetical protein [Rhizobium]WSH11127.1 hypothetical protein U8P72_28980 [Rhizobium johnstonii]MDV4166169.1 hypothetical protein [Rhizobium leguminosarum]MDV4176649.1 hypothetical protein [Rhizobium leguminosarum]TBB60435.1 hypothetical protein ELH45_34450 [Rhizobium ruizarguesonis]TBB82860.1 hypothetical protein ELH39_32730 [Rhizobium ruizarguesonis]